MSPQGKKLFKKILSWASYFFFFLAAYMIYLQLHKYEFQEIVDSISEIPNMNLVYAGMASFLGYIALSLYDFLALKYVRRKLSSWKWIMAGFVGFSISNNAGHAILSGGTIRYRFYTRWRLKASEIVKMVMFSGFTYLWACCGLIILGYFLTPSHAFGDGSVSYVTTLVVVIGSALALLLYFILVIFYRKSLTIKGIEFHMPTFGLALSQVIIGGADILLASLVLYFALIPFVHIDFSVFIGVFIIAQVLGVYSQVPGGLGVFEGLFMYILPDEEDKAGIFAALIAYRIIYYLLPLVISGFIISAYEGGLRHRMVKAKEDYLLRKRSRQQNHS